MTFTARRFACAWRTNSASRWSSGSRPSNSPRTSSMSTRAKAATIPTMSSSTPWLSAATRPEGLPGGPRRGSPNAPPAGPATLAAVTACDDGALPPDLFAATLALLEKLTAISSVSGDAAGLGRMAARLGAVLAARGLEVEVLQGLGSDGHGDGAGPSGGGLPVVVARGPAVAAGRGHLLLVGHLDTVLPAVPPRRDGDRLVATGAIDMKGGLATLAGALDLLARRGVAPPADLLLVAVPDEEVGGELAHAAVERWGAGARALWVLEPGEPGSAPGAETLVGGRRGLFDWRLEARGKAAHSGLHLAAGRSALLAAARWCLAAAGMRGDTALARGDDAAPPFAGHAAVHAGDEAGQPTSAATGSRGKP